MVYRQSLNFIRIEEPISPFKRFRCSDPLFLYTSRYSGWQDVDVADIPPLTLKHIHQFFISEVMVASKPSGAVSSSSLSSTGESSPHWIAPSTLQIGH